MSELMLCKGATPKRLNMKSVLRTYFLWLLLAPYAFYGLGAALNQAVLIANHDRFPVLVNSVKIKSYQDDDKVGTDMLDNIHCVMTHETHLNALADIFDRQGSTMSIGDFFIEFGVWANTFVPFVWFALVARERYCELQQKGEI